MRGKLLFSILTASLLALGAQPFDTSLKASKAQGGPELPLPRIPSVGELPAPDLERLKKEREDLQKELAKSGKETEGSDASLEKERTLLRIQLAELLRKLNERKSPPEPKITGGGVPAKVDPVETIRPLDPLSQAQSLYQTRNFEAALRALKLLDLATFSREDRAFVQYLMASCHRRLGKLSEAAALYREVAEGRDDEFLTECAIWQLSNIRWRQELEAQLEELRLRRKALLP